jgi:hypothetical protein
VVEYSLEIENEEQLKRLLRELPRVLNKHLITAGKKSALAIQSRAATYPPPPTNSSYLRTGTLGRRWGIEGPKASGDGVTTLVQNPTSYGPYVMGEDEQAAVHRGRWATLKQIAEQAERQVVEFHVEALNAAVKEMER